MIFSHIFLVGCSIFYEDSMSKSEENVQKVCTTEKAPRCQTDPTSESNSVELTSKTENDIQTFYLKRPDDSYNSNVFYSLTDQDIVSHSDAEIDPVLVFSEYDKSAETESSCHLLYSCSNDRNLLSRKNWNHSNSQKTPPLSLYWDFLPPSLEKSSSNFKEQLNTFNTRHNFSFKNISDPVHHCSYGEENATTSSDLDLPNPYIFGKREDSFDIDLPSPHMNEKVETPSEQRLPNSDMNEKVETPSEQRLPNLDTYKMVSDSLLYWESLIPVLNNSETYPLLHINGHNSHAMHNTEIFSHITHLKSHSDEPPPGSIDHDSSGSAIRPQKNSDRDSHTSMENTQNCSGEQRGAQVYNPLYEMSCSLDRLNRNENITHSISPHGQPSNISAHPLYHDISNKIPPEDVVEDRYTSRLEMMKESTGSYEADDISDRELEEDLQEIESKQYNSKVKTETTVKSQTHISNIGIKNDVKERTITNDVLIQLNVKSKDQSLCHYDEPNPKSHIRLLWNRFKSAINLSVTGSNEQSRKKEQKNTKVVFNNRDEKANEYAAVYFVENEEQGKERSYSKKVEEKQGECGTEEEDLVSPTGELHDSTISKYLQLLEEYAFIFKNKIVLSIPVSIVELIKKKFMTPDLFKSFDFSDIISQIDYTRPDLLLIPFYINGHYQLFIVNGEVIEFYDSLFDDEYFASMFGDFLKKTNFYGEAQFSVLIKNIPKQLNHLDCGVFLCLNARYRMEKEQITYPIDRIPIARRHINQELGLRSISPILPCDASEETLITMDQEE